MSEDTSGTTTDAAAPTPFTMVGGDSAAMLCEGDVCYVPGFSANE